MQITDERLEGIEMAAALRVLDPDPVVRELVVYVVVLAEALRHQRQREIPIVALPVEL